MKKIVFPAIAALSMISNGSATLTTVIGPDGVTSLVDTAITAGQVIQLAVGGQIYQGPAVACVAAATINIIATPENNAGSCLFLVNESFGTSATAGTAAATICAIGDCSNVDLCFFQKSNAQASTSTGIYVKGKVRNIYSFSADNFTNKIAFYRDSSLSESITPIFGVPAKIRAFTPSSMIPSHAYFKNTNDRAQLTKFIKASKANLTQNDVDAIATSILSLIEYNE